MGGTVLNPRTTSGVVKTIVVAATATMTTVSIATLVLISE
jgi:hypothetical protein